MCYSFFHSNRYSLYSTKDYTRKGLWVKTTNSNEGDQFQFLLLNYVFVALLRYKSSAYDCWCSKLGRRISPLGKVEYRALKRECLLCLTHTKDYDPLADLFLVVIISHVPNTCDRKSSSNKIIQTHNLGGAWGILKGIARRKSSNEFVARCPRYFHHTLLVLRSCVSS